MCKSPISRRHGLVVNPTTYPNKETSYCDPLYPKAMGRHKLHHEYDHDEE